MVADRLPPWEWNRRVGWCSTAVGVLSGLVMGLWSFDGPLPTPDWIGEYGDVSRRLARLGHIAFFGLGFLNLLLSQELPRSSLGRGALRTASAALIFGNLFLPATLFAAAVYHPLKYTMPVPALAVAVAVTLAARGAWRRDVNSSHSQTP